MINVSDEVKQAYDSSTTQVDKIVLNGTEYRITNVEYYDDVYNEGNIFGTAIAKGLDFEIENIVNLEGQEIEYLTGIKIDGVIQWISLGNFIVQTVESNDTTNINKVSAMDYMLKTNIPYETSLDYESGTITILQVLQEACDNSGLDLATTNFVNSNFIVDSNQFDEGTLNRQVIQAVAQVSGTVAKIRNNKLYLLSPSTTVSKVFTLNNYKEAEIKRATHPINVVSLGLTDVEGENITLRDEESISKNGENILSINDNPFAYTQAKREQLIAALFDAVKGFEYKAYTFDCQGLPYLETMDKIQFKDKKGNTYDSYVFRFNYKSPNGLDSTIEAPSITSATVNYQNVPSALDIARKVEYRVNKQEGKITQIVSSVEEIEEELVLTATTEEGKEFHLTDTADSNCKSVEIFGESKTETKVPKNILPSFNESSMPDEGLTFVINDDGSIAFNGSETSGYSMLWFGEGEMSLNDPIPISAGTYTLSVRHTGTIEGMSVITTMFQNYTDYPVLIIGQQESVTFTLENDDYIEMIMMANEPGTVFTDFTIYPQLETGPEMTEYEAPRSSSSAVVINIDEVNIKSTSENGEESITTIQLLHGLCSLENGVRDRISKIGSKWYDVQNIGYTESEGPYELTEPVVTEITDEATIKALESIKTYKGVTNIESNAPIILTYYRDTTFVEEYETKNDANSKYRTTTEKFAQQEITNESITTDVSRIDTSLTNDYMTKEEASTQYQQLDSSFNFAINNAITELKENGISKVVTTTVKIDDNGLTTGRSDSDFTNTMNNTGNYQYHAGELIAKYDKDGADIPRLKSDFAIIAGLKSVREDVDGVIHHKTYVLE